MLSQQLVPPGSSAETLNGSHLTTPVNDDRSFLVPENPWPLDPVSLELGLPIALPIAQRPPNKKFYSLKTNGHHAAGFPDEHPYLQAEDDRVLRWSRVQEGLRILHWRAHEYYDGVTLPDNEHEHFLVTLLNSANYASPYGLDLSQPKPKIVRLSEPELMALQAPGILHQQEGMHWRIGHYFGRYIIKHGVEPIREAVVVSDFLEAKDPARRLKLGHDVIRLAAETVISPIESVYESARKQGSISPNNPARAVRFMMKHFDQRQVDYFETMMRKLVA